MSGGGGGTYDLYAITPEGEYLYPDADGVLHCSIDDQIVTLGGGGGGGISK